MSDTQQLTDRGQQTQFGGQQQRQGDQGSRQQQYGQSQTGDQSGQIERRGQLMSVTWDELDSEGAYVDQRTGDLFRVPQQAVIRGASPIIQKVSHGQDRLVRVSEDPYCPILRAREVAANNNISPNF